MPYNPTWNNPYMPAQSPYSPNVPLGGQSVIPSYPSGQQYNHGRIMADGPVEAQNRLYTMYQPSQLVPGFVSDTVWDVNGRQFYSLSIENDGRRNFETFDFTPHKEESPVQIDGAQFVSRQEYDNFVAKVSAALEAINNGVHATVPAAVPDAGLQGKDGTVALHVARGHAPADTTVC